MGNIICKEDKSKHWIAHNNIKIEDIPEGVNFKRKPEDTTEGKFPALYTKPLKKACTFKMNVEQIDPENRVIELGIMKKSKYDEIRTKSNFITEKDFVGTIAFDGLGNTSGFTGDSMSIFENSGEMNALNNINVIDIIKSGNIDNLPEFKFVSGSLRNGSCVFLHYDPGVEVKFYNDGRLDLKKSMEGDEEEYYLYCVLESYMTKFSIEKIK